MDSGFRTEIKYRYIDIDIYIVKLNFHGTVVEIKRSRRKRGIIWELLPFTYSVEK